LDILADPLAIIELAGIEASLTIRADKVRLSREPLMARGCDVHNVPEIVPEGRLGIGPAEFPAAVHPFAVIPDVEGQRANGGGHDATLLNFTPSQTTLRRPRKFVFCPQRRPQVGHSNVSRHDLPQYC
jgi:hypothetical protein